MNGVPTNNKKRILIAFAIISVLLAVLSVRTAWIQVVRADEYRQMAIEQQTSDIPLEAKRGNIYDRNGNELATSATCYSIWLRPGDLRDAYPNDEKQNEIAQKLASLLDMSSEELKADFGSSQTLIQIAKYQENDTCEKIKDMEINGVSIAKGTKRYYPFGTSLSQLLGSVNDDNEGRTGIESTYNNYLSGIPGRWVQDTDVNGNTLAYGSKRYYNATDGYNITLTLDEVLQHYAEQAIETGLKKTKASRVMFLAMDPTTGDVLAMACTGSYDSNNATEPINEKDKKKFDKMDGKEQTAYLSEMWKNPLISNLYEPGSTFKLITTSASLEEGVTTPKDKFNDVGWINVDGVILHCWHVGHGKENLVEAVGNSCNPVQVELVMRLGAEKFYNYIDMFGFSDKTHIELPGEEKALIRPISDLTNVDLATMSYGQGIAVTPIQLLTAVNAIGNKGIIMKPRVVKKITDQDGNIVKEIETEEVRQVISEKTASEMCDIMEYVVAEGGGGNAKIDGYRIGGKTGTANIAENGKYTSSTYSSFLGMAPMDDPRITVLAIVEKPKGSNTGSMVAAPIAKEFLENALPYLEIDPKYTNEQETANSAGMVQVPDVVGMKSSAARSSLNGIGLSCEVVPAGTTAENFEVVDQYPKPGTVVERNTTIYIYKE
ncbi:MAG: PASTA domain-containing protein [Eubacterium sp.]|nr:PASTA domain-containing protein [Eubacterium sp.]